jgi:outer membrane protein assembly factor BamB
MTPAFHRVSQGVLPLLLLLVCGARVPPSAAADWPRFRGPDGLAISPDTDIPIEWGDKKNLKWARELPGQGFSSPIVVGDSVFVTCYSGGGRDLTTLKRYLVAVDRRTGEILWSKMIPAVLPEFRSGGGFAHHGYASSSPVSDGESVFVLFGTTGVLAFDLKGNQLWQQSVGTETNARFGSGSSPILYADLVIVTAGAESESIRALNKKTGKEVWKAPANSLAECYGTPLIVKNKEGEDELVISVPYEVWGLNPKTGKLKWYAGTQVDGNVCTSLIAEDGIVYAVGGRNGGRTAVKVGGKGDVTKTNVLWSKRGGSYVPSPVLHKGYLYWVDQRGVATCVDAKTGNEMARERLGGDFYASLVLVKDRLYAVSRFNGTYVLEASPKLTQIAHNRLADGSDFSGSPAVSGGQLVLRSDKYLYCIAAK